MAEQQAAADHWMFDALFEDRLAAAIASHLRDPPPPPPVVQPAAAAAPALAVVQEPLAQPDRPQDRVPIDLLPNLPENEFIRRYEELRVRYANQGFWLYVFGDDPALLEDADRKGFRLVGEDGQPALWELVPHSIGPSLFWIDIRRVRREVRPENDNLPDLRYDTVAEFHATADFVWSREPRQFTTEQLLNDEQAIIELLRNPPQRPVRYGISVDAPAEFRLRRNLGPFDLAHLADPDRDNLLTTLRSQCTPASTPEARTRAARESDWRGVRSPTWFPGTLGSTFAIHTEDEDLPSVNVLVWGAPKVWYVVPPNYYERVIELIRELILEFDNENDYEYNCTNPTRHKDLFPDPAILRERNIPFRRVVQGVGEMIVLLPRAFHFG